ncbi:hypothetical protein [uncultured Litoreibacter sp.]|uniref:hypothetical protein n=1 Tax=uncultured Litoreibacter sp. TaxID=1392394 RepID=UPI0026173E53|nr:hypothetical protein [uncultured Litoreibacter sp.]
MWHQLKAQTSQHEMVAGLSPVHNEYRRKTMTEWRRDVLPYAWEDILKFEKTKPQWKIDNSIFIIRAYPHRDSVDPLLIAMHLKSDREAVSYAATLRDMPKGALEERLEEEGRFYTFVKPQLRKALRGR